VNADDTPAPFRPVRRLLLRRVTGFAAGSLFAPAFAQIRQPEQPQPGGSARAGFMDRAFEMRRRAIERGDQPYGAVIVREGRIVGEGISAVVTDRDPTAHAEMQAIRDAARRLGTNDLSACEMYGTSRACPMCEAAAYWARISRMYYGSSNSDAGSPKLS
jgi:tRNA(Arg) A34 adenosine deaminase TadA